MDDHDRATLLATAAPARGEVWCDMGCGDGAFALPLLDQVGDSGYLVAVDSDAHALSMLRAALVAKRTIPERYELRTADLTAPGALPPLDGVVFANSLHYLPRPADSLGAVREALKPGARVLIIEYDRADATPRVPYPIPATTLSALARDASFPTFDIAARVRSDFGRSIYAAVALWRSPRQQSSNR